MRIQELQGVQTEIHLVSQNRQYFCLGLPVLQRIDSPRLVGGSILLLRTDLNPLVHCDRALLQEQILDGSSTWRILPCWWGGALRGGRSIIGFLRDDGGWVCLLTTALDLAGMTKSDANDHGG